MNSTQQDRESFLPDIYEIEISEKSQRLLDVNFAAHNETTTHNSNNNGTVGFSGNKLIIRPDEALIVILVLILWIVAIGLFVHRWGKIRNCEPYTPKFHDAESSHRSSCHDQANLINKRLSMTKSSTVLQPIQPSCGSINIQQQQQQHFVPSSSLQQPSYNGYHPIRTRQRQNSMFSATSSYTITTPQQQRKYKSELDLQSIVSEGETEVV